MQLRTFRQSPMHDIYISNALRFPLAPGLWVGCTSNVEPRNLAVTPPERPPPQRVSVHCTGFFTVSLLLSRSSSCIK